MNKKVILILVTIGILALILGIISAVRLPTVNGDSGTWGTVLNEFLNVSLNESGEIRPTNLTLAEKLTFSFGEFLDNIVNNWIRITGNLNVTENIQVSGNITASNFVGNLNGTLDGYDSTFFMPLNTSVSGDFDFNGGWLNDGLSIIGGDIYAQVGYFYNITSLNVTKQNLTILTELIVDGRVGIGTTTPQQKLNVIGDINVTGSLWIGTINVSNWLYNQSDGSYNSTYHPWAYNQTYTGITGKWNVSGSNLFPYDLSKNVGIGTSNPQQKLNVIGKVNITQNLTVDANTLFVNADNNRVGIGTSTPTNRFHVSSTNVANAFLIDGTTGNIGIGNIPHGTTVGFTYYGVYFKHASNNGNFICGHGSSPWYAFIRGNSAVDLYWGLDADTGKYVFRGTGDFIVKNGSVGIGTENPSYPLEVNGQVGDVSIYASHNISATGFITRTSIFDKSKGSALSFIQDASYYLDGGEINHSKFYGYAGEFEVTDYSISEIETYDCFTLNEKTGEEVKNTCERIIYPYKKMEAGVLLDKEIDVLRQALVEIKSCTEVSYDWEAYKNCVNKV